MGLTTLMNAQNISGDGIEVVEFNASFSSSKCEFLESLEDCETLRIDIFELYENYEDAGPAVAGDYKNRIRLQEKKLQSAEFELMNLFI